MGVYTRLDKNHKKLLSGTIVKALSLNLLALGRKRYIMKYGTGFLKLIYYLIICKRILIKLRYAL